jgi:hypothetical protein
MAAFTSPAFNAEVARDTRSSDDELHPISEMVNRRQMNLVGESDSADKSKVFFMPKSNKKGVVKTTPFYTNLANYSTKSLGFFTLH